MLQVDMDARSVGRIRFALSPAHEVIGLLATAVSSRAAPASNQVALRQSLHRGDVRLLAELLRRQLAAHRMPDHLLPIPGTGAVPVVLRDQLDSVAATSREVMIEQLNLCGAAGSARDSVLRRALEMPSAAAALAQAMAHLWRVVLADTWPTLHHCLAADLAYRSDRASREGIGSAVASLHGDVAWSGAGLSIHWQRWQERVALQDTGLVLVPTLHGPTSLAVQVCDPSAAGVSYAARRGSALPGADEQKALIGASRARILRILEVPRSTGEVGALVALSPATASYHLGILHRAGLVSRERHGRVVCYRAVQRPPG